MRYTLLLIAIGLLVLTYLDKFAGVNAGASDKEIDGRAVSVLRGTITHVRDGDTFKSREHLSAFQPWIVLKTARAQDKKLPNLLGNSRASKLFANSLAQKPMIELLDIARLRAKTLPN